MKKVFILLSMMLMIISGCSSKQSYIGSWESIKVTQGDEVFENVKGSYLVVDKDNKVTLVIDKWIDEMELKDYDNRDILVYHGITLNIQMNEKGHIILDYPMNDEIAVIEYVRSNAEDVSNAIDAIRKDN